MPRTHYLSGEDVHYKWDVSNEPLIVIDPGDTVVVWTRDISDSQVSPDADASVLANFDRRSDSTLCESSIRASWAMACGPRSLILGLPSSR